MPIPVKQYIIANFSLDTLRDVVIKLVSPPPPPPLTQVVEVNRSLTEAVETLSNHSNETLGHLQLIIEWWSEFNSNHGDMSSWLSGMEERAAGLEAQLESTVSPRPCPLSLQQLAKVTIYYPKCSKLNFKETKN